jgi:hypothetical protein
MHYIVVVDTGKGAQGEGNTSNLCENAPKNHEHL